MTATETTITDALGIVRLDRPQVLNAMNTAMIDEIEAALDRLEADAAVRAVIFVGTGRAFCVGTDLKEHSGDGEGRVARMHRLVMRLDAYPKLTLTAFNGLALGGGLELGMACAFRVATPGARLGLPEVTHGLMPAYGGTQLLPRLVGIGKALEIALSGEMIDAQEAHAIGLVNAVADDALAGAIALARRCTRWGQVAPHEIRRAILASAGLPLEHGLAVEAQGVSQVAASEECRAGLAAFANRSH